MCLQIDKIPEDMSKYYNQNYPSFDNPVKFSFSRIFRKVRDKYIFTGKGFLGKIFYTFFSFWPLEPDLFRKNNILEKDKSILDVGCGTGKLLLTLKENGFNNLLGIDPFLEKDIEYENGLKILKKALQELTDKFDIIMLNHSLEHIPNQLETIRAASRLLNKNGICVIRIPVVSSFAWETYKEYWNGIAPPMHFFLHSIKSMNILAGMANMKIENTLFDSCFAQFFYSELNAKRKSHSPLKMVSRYLLYPYYLINYPKIMKYKRKAEKLNEQGRGDYCCFILRNV
jgi:2-polyprenyl-3-methyl-5-hydroxy-6-metoxy-1,4-benzoquinol methylase